VLHSVTLRIPRKVGSRGVFLCRLSVSDLSRGLSYPSTRDASQPHLSLPLDALLEIVYYVVSGAHMSEGDKK
jgi:hypothetical protein